MSNQFKILLGSLVLIGTVLFYSCKPKNAGSVVSGDAAQKTYVPPGNMMVFTIFIRRV